MRWAWIVAIAVVAAVGIMAYAAVVYIKRGGSYNGGLSIKVNGWKVWINGCSSSAPVDPHRPHETVATASVSPAMPWAVESEALTMRYGAAVAVDGVTLQVPPACKVALVGPNGSGKTTLIHLLAGLLRPTAGSAYVLGHEVASETARGLIGIAPDDLPLPGTLTGFELLDLTARLRRVPVSAEIMELMDLLGLSAALGRQVGEYSHGMKRKVQLACALIHHPAVLFLDEPYRGLDPMSEMLLRSIIDVMADSGSAVVASTHSLEITGADFDVIGIMDRGSLVEFGLLTDLLDRHGVPSVRDLFLRVTETADEVADNARSVRRLLTRAASPSDVEHPEDHKMKDGCVET